MLVSVWVSVMFGSSCWAGQLDKVGMYLGLGRPDDALELLDRIISANPQNVDAYSSRAFVNLKLARHNQAISDFSAIINIKPDDPDAWLSRGLVYDQLHDPGRAASDYKQACFLGDSSGCSFLSQMNGRAKK
jgi:tetratricopeptide (TPR) repeat protein